MQIRGMTTNESSSSRSKVAKTNSTTTRTAATPNTTTYTQSSQDFYTQQPVFTEAELMEYDNAKVYKSKLDRISPSIEIVKKNIQTAQECMADGGLVCEGFSLNPKFDSILEKFYYIERAINLSSEHFQRIITKVESMKY